MNALRPGDLERMLGRVDHAPDVTRAVMGRLGYMSVPARVADRRRRLRLASRLALVALIAGGAFAGMRVQQDAPTARRPVGTTLTDAMDRQLERGDTAVRDSLRSIRRIVAPVAPAGATMPMEREPLERAIERSGIGPVAGGPAIDGDAPC